MSILQGLDQEGLLERLVTTLALDPASPWLAGVERLLPERWRSKLRRRAVPDFLRGKTHGIWFGEAARQLSSHLASPILTHRVWHWAETRFDAQVARRYAGCYAGLYGMEHSSLASFQRQKAAGGYCLLRQVNAHGRTAARIFQQQAERFPELLSAYHRQVLRESEGHTLRREREYALADLIVANSAFVRDTFLAQGVAREKIVYVPTGFPALSAKAARAGRGAEKIRFLYAGSLSLRKGAIDLLRAWRQWLTAEAAELWLAGSVQLPSHVLDEYRDDVRLLGPVPKETLQQLFLQSDVFVLPTLCEGMAHVVLEAMSHGLPVITTRESGCAEFVVDDENGWIVRSGDEADLARALLDALRRRERLPALGRGSRAKAGAWTVAQSNQAHLAYLKQFIEGRNLADGSN